ncbi:MAG: hypothetical protein ACREA0_22795 [bacterium]
MCNRNQEISGGAAVGALGVMRVGLTGFAVVSQLLSLSDDLRLRGVLF